MIQSICQGVSSQEDLEVQHRRPASTNGFDVVFQTIGTCFCAKWW